LHGFADAFVLQMPKLLYPILPNYVLLCSRNLLNRSNN
jgi:hypothetical protein